MKILYSVIQFPVIGGSSLLVQGLSQSLSKLGHDTVIFTSDRPINVEIKSTENFIIKRIPFLAYDFFFKTLFKNNNSKFLKFFKKAINGIEWFFIYKINKLAKKYSFPLLWGLFIDQFGWKLLLKMLISNLRDIDVIYTTPVPRSIIAATLLAGKIKKIPITIAPSYHCSNNNYTMYDDFWGKILRKFNMVFPHTNAELNYLNKIGVPKKIQKTMGVGISFQKINSAGFGDWRNKLKIPKSKFTVLYMNTSINSYNKGVDSVIKSSVLLPSVHFIFVGRFRKDWGFLKKKYDLIDAKNISYIEFVSNKEKYQLLNSIDLVVKPSLVDSFGIFYFEGLSAGKPIICADVAPMKEISKDVGFSVPFDDVEQLVDKIKYLKENKKIYEKLSKNAIIKAENYSWENLGKKFERVFKKIRY